MIGLELSPTEEQWGKKSDTNSGDLYSAIMCYMRKNCEGTNCLSNLNKFLDAIRPPSGWMEDGDYNPQLDTVRAKYGNDFYLLHRRTKE